MLDERILSGRWETSHRLTATCEGVLDVLPFLWMQGAIGGALTRHLLSNFMLAADIEVALTAVQAGQLLEVGLCTVYVALSGLYCLQVLQLLSHPDKLTPTGLQPHIHYRPLDLILTLNVSLPPFLLAPMLLMLRYLLVTAVVDGKVSL